MSYYNQVWVIYKTPEGSLEYVPAGCWLPRNTVPVAIINWHKKIIFEVINECDKDVIFEFIKDRLQDVQEECARLGWRDFTFIPS